MSAGDRCKECGAVIPAGEGNGRVVQRICCGVNCLPRIGSLRVLKCNVGFHNLCHLVFGCAHHQADGVEDGTSVELALTLEVVAEDLVLFRGQPGLQ